MIVIWELPFDVGTAHPTRELLSLRGSCSVCAGAAQSAQELPSLRRSCPFNAGAAIRRGSFVVMWKLRCDVEASL
jgi:hypothetical protein